MSWDRKFIQRASKRQLKKMEISCKTKCKRMTNALVTANSGTVVIGREDPE